MSDVNITAKSNPFAQEPPDADLFYSTLGRIQTLWSRLEYHFDIALCAIERVGQQAGWTRRSPGPMAQKLDFWVDAFKTLAPLAPMRANALNLSNDLRDAARDRNLLTHGTWAGFSSERPLTANFQRIQRKKEGWLFERVPVSLEGLNRLLRAIDEANTALLPLTFALVQLQLQQPSPDS